MKKKILIFAISILTIGGLVYVLNQTETKTETEKLREKHTAFLKNHPYNKTINLPRKERKDLGLAPNAYFEQEYLNEINPSTGKTNKRALLKLQVKLIKERSQQRVPGDASDNSWVERGPNNVGGRTRALIFDPNDATNETVFAGGVSGGLWKNTNISNANSQWTNVAIPENLAISSIAIDPNNSNIWYVGTGESYVGGDVNGNGVWKSIDGGNSWNHIFGGVEGKSILEIGTKITVNSPSSIKGDYATVLTTDFGGNLNTPVSGVLALANDGINPNEDGCSALTNSANISGKIAVIRRGNCAFVDKAKNAQNAGAIAVIVVNNVEGNPARMAGEDASITIPALMVSKSDGNLLINKISEGVNVTISNTDKDSGFNVSNGIQFINDIIVRNNNGVSEVFATAGETFYSDASPSTLISVNNTGLYKSVDGVNFSKVSLATNPNDDNYTPNKLDIAVDNSIFVSTTSNVYGDGGGSIFKSSNGSNFTLVHQVPNGLRTEISCSKTNANVVYVLAQLSTSPLAIYKTTDNFANVTSLSLPNDADPGIPANDFARGQAGYNLLIKVDPINDDVVYVGGIDLFKSSDGGTSWKQISKWHSGNSQQSYFLDANLPISVVHADQHGLAFSSSSRMIFGNDGGVYFSDDAATNIDARNLGYNTVQFYTIGVAPTTAFTGDYFLAGAQDNGTQLFENANPSINGSIDVSGGDGAASFFDQDGTDKYFIVNYVYNSGIRLYDFNTQEYRTINNEDVSNGDFINQQDLDSNLDRLYSNYSSGSNYIIKRYSNLKSGTVTAVNLTNDLLNASPSYLKISPYTTNASNLFVGLKTGRLLFISRANSIINNWSDITGPEFIGTVSDIEFGASEDEIFVTMHNYGVQSIWYTSDKGVTWQAKEGNLPDIPVKAILQNPLNRKEVIIGTELGIWRTNDITIASPIWIQSYNGMSNVKVTDLDLRTDNTVFASTYGRGVFSGKFTAETASVEDVLTDKKEFTIYPTISDGNFTLFAKNSLGKTKMNIFNLNGKEVYKSEINFNKNEKHKISVQLNAGVYIVNLTDENNKKSSNKIIIE